jgi:hypothetical protein
VLVEAAVCVLEAGGVRAVVVTSPVELYGTSVGRNSACVRSGTKPAEKGRRSGPVKKLLLGPLVKKGPDEASDLLLRRLFCDGSVVGKFSNGRNFSATQRKFNVRSSTYSQTRLAKSPRICPRSLKFQAFRHKNLNFSVLTKIIW